MNFEEIYGLNGEWINDKVYQIINRKVNELINNWEI